MPYFKNVPGWERGLRISGGAVLLLLGLTDVLALQSTLLGWNLAAGGLFIMGTGFIGFCPMCALVGRKRVEREKP